MMGSTLKSQVDIFIVYSLIAVGDLLFMVSCELHETYLFVEISFLVIDEEIKLSTFDIR